MPKVTIEFELPEENEEFAITNSAAGMASFLGEFKNHLRALVKYGDYANYEGELKPKYKDVPTAIETLYEEFCEGVYNTGLGDLL
jgi:hypothetical protein